MAGSVGGVTGPAHRTLSEVSGVAAEAPLVDPPFRGAVKGQPPVFQIVDRLDRFFSQDMSGLLVDQVVAAFNRVKGVPLRLVLFDVAQCRTDAPLRGSSVAADRIEFGKHRRFRLAAGFQSGV